MRDEPELGTREDARGIHGLGKVEYEIVDGEIVWGEGGADPGDGDRGARRQRRAHPPRPQRRADRGLRDRLRRPQPDLDLALHRRDAAGRRLSRPAGPARRRRRARALAGGRAGPQHRRAGCGEPRLEARRGRQRHRRPTACSTPTTPSATRSLPACCATRWPRPRCAAPDARTKALGETVAELLSMDEPRRRFAAMQSGLDIRYDLGEGHPLLGRRMPDLDLVGADGAAARLRAAARRATGPAGPRRRRRRAGAGGSRRVPRSVGASRRGARPRSGAVLIRPTATSRGSATGPRRASPRHSRGGSG